MEEGIKHNNCIRFFFEFRKAFNDKHRHYEGNYGLIPKFKAGVADGKVTVAEVGEIKKELAYHGDILNTAASIQGRCNEFQTDLLISQRLRDLMNTTFKDQSELIGNVRLKGKEEAINIYKIMDKFLEDAIYLTH